jgi:hypothetical protein
MPCTQINVLRSPSGGHTHKLISDSMAASDTYAITSPVTVAWRKGLSGMIDRALHRLVPAKAFG